jgi:hypothetical protein
MTQQWSESRGAVYVLCAGVIGGAAGGIFAPAAYLHGYLVGNGVVFLGAAGALLGAIPGFFACLATRWAYRKLTRRGLLAFVQHALAVGAACVSAALAGWAALQFVAWAIGAV